MTVFWLVLSQLHLAIGIHKKWQPRQCKIDTVTLQTQCNNLEHSANEISASYQAAAVKYLNWLAKSCDRRDKALLAQHNSITYFGPESILSAGHLIKASSKYPVIFGKHCLRSLCAKMCLSLLQYHNVMRHIINKEIMCYYSKARFFAAILQFRTGLGNPGYLVAILHYLQNEI